MQRNGHAMDLSVGREGQLIPASSAAGRVKRVKRETHQERYSPVLGAAFKENRNSELRNSGYVLRCASNFKRETGNHLFPLVNLPFRWFITRDPSI